MITLYHGSNVVVESVDLNLCLPYRDFGRGFYLTRIRKQAENMATTVSLDRGGNGVVSVFEFHNEIAKLQGLNILEFHSPNVKWAQFVINNRNPEFTDFEHPLCNFDFKYDIVSGPVANDKIRRLMRLYISNLITLELLVQKLEYIEPTSQYSFHTPRACQLLQFKEAYNV
ncbi:MAG: DUF3990 domain-containing protein [Proteobacteria bacterium]|nr:DUF3990 domain-containing protein [Pseudomonadota bacterium]